MSISVTRFLRLVIESTGKGKRATYYLCDKNLSLLSALVGPTNDDYSNDELLQRSKPLGMFSSKLNLYKVIKHKQNCFYSLLSTLAAPLAVAEDYANPETLQSDNSLGKLAS